MLQMFCEMVNIVLDTSHKFGIISHTEPAVSLKGCKSRRYAVLFYRRCEALSHPQNALPGYDSQFFATTLYLPEPAGKFAPPIVID